MFRSIRCTVVAGALIGKSARNSSEAGTRWTPHIKIAIKSEIIPNPDTYGRIVELLISNGADVNAKNNDGNTPLHLASEQKLEAYRQISRALIAKGADTNAKNNEGQTPDDLLSAAIKFFLYLHKCLVGVTMQILLYFKHKGS